MLKITQHGVEEPATASARALSLSWEAEGPEERLTFARPDVVQVELVALLGAFQGALGGKEVAGGVEGLVVVAAHLLAEHRAPSSFPKPSAGPHWLVSEMGTPRA